MTLVIPGVEVTVVKDVVPQQLAPSGVLGIVGLTEAGGGVARASSWSRFRELFGPGTAYSIPEARLALDNGVYELVVSPIASSAAIAAGAALPLSTSEGGGAGALHLSARARGTWANGLKVRVQSRKPAGNGAGRPPAFDLEMERPGGDREVFRQLSAVPGEPGYVVDVLANPATSTVVTASADDIRLASPVETVIKQPLEGATGGDSLPVLLWAGSAVATLVAKVAGAALKVTIGAKQITLGIQTAAAGTFGSLGDPIDLTGLKLPGAESKIVGELRSRLDLALNQHTSSEGTSPYFALDVVAPGWPADGQITLGGGADAEPSEYQNALLALRDEPDVDMVLAAVQDFSSIPRVTQIYSDIVSHCTTMSDQCKGRIGLGQAPPMTPAARSAREHVEMASNLVSDRFVLVSPHGVLGAVAGMIGSLPCHQSPTFKPVAGLGRLATKLNVDEQAELLKGFVVPVAKQPGKGLVVLRGLTTDGDQINVRRVADRAVRGVKMIGDLFIGSLNTEDGRSALRQKIHEHLLQMQKDGALVPSTDGTDPAFKVNVYSSQTDFALGIVRVDIAVRPVRAIDYIYATILIQT